MFFREDMNFSIIDGCDDEAAGQDLRFSVRNKKETNQKKQALAGSIRRTATPRTVFPDLLPCRRPKMPRHFFIGQNTCPKKTRKTLYEHGDMPDSLHPVANSHVLPLAFANKKATWHHKGTKNRIARHTRIARQSIIRIFRS